MDVPEVELRPAFSPPVFALIVIFILAGYSWLCLYLFMRRYSVQIYFAEHIVSYITRNNSNAVILAALCPSITIGNILNYFVSDHMIGALSIFSCLRLLAVGFQKVEK